MYQEHPNCIIEKNDQEIWRYMDLAKYISILTSSSLYFSSLHSLKNDPWEGLLPLPHLDPNQLIEVTQTHIDEMKSKNIVPSKDLQAGSFINQADFFSILDPTMRFEGYAELMKNGIKEFKKRFFINSWHMNSFESDALWKIYGKNEQCIAIRSNIESLKKSFENENKNIFIGQVAYKDEKTEPLDDVSNYFNVCLRKRNEFKHEKEIRAIYMDERGDWKNNKEFHGLQMKVNLKILIKEVVISPMSEQWLVDTVRNLHKQLKGFEFLEGMTRKSKLLDDVYI